MTKYEIADRIRALLDYDLEQLIDVAQELAQEIEITVEDE